MDKFTSSVVDDEEHVHCSKPDCMNREQVTHPNIAGVTMQELSPTGRGRSDVWSSHIPGDRTCTNHKAKTCQFCLDSTLPPQLILLGKTTNEFPELEVDFFASGSRPAA